MTCSLSTTTYKRGLIGIGLQVFHCPRKYS
nr:MAG TPA: hypothetical protein [Caudoviricetes sp.]